MSPWIKDQDGNPSVIVTLVIISFVATTVAYCLSIVQQIGHITFRPFDVSATGAYFGAILATYCAHHWVNGKYNNDAPAAAVPNGEK